MDLRTHGGQINVAFDPAMLAQFQKGNFAGIRPEIIQLTQMPGPLEIMGFK